MANQARLQLEQRRDGRHRYEFLEPEDRRGFQRLPKAAVGDLFFDVESDPFIELTYLFGISSRDSKDHLQYRSWWAHDEHQEQRAFEAVIDFILERRLECPEAHIYHYGPADVLALKQLMGRYGSREQEWMICFVPRLLSIY